MQSLINWSTRSFRNGSGSHLEALLTHKSFHLGSMDTTNIGIVGCGDILHSYMIGLSRFGAPIRTVWCADLILPRAEAAAALYGIPRWGSIEEVLADEEVELVVSLTPPAVHHEVISAAAATGKHVFTEKPLAATTTLALDALDDADKHGIRVGAAPDTFLGPSGQTARAAIDGGVIGQPIACTAFSPYSRAERRHPNPGFLFQPGAGPLMDTAPYFVSALINLLGPVASAGGLARTSSPLRRVPRPSGEVDEIAVNVPTHVAALIQFAGGVVCTFVTSFDIWDHQLPAIEIYGTEGTLALPHPNWFDGEVKLKLHDDEDWRPLSQVLPPLQIAPREKVRGLGLVDLVDSLDGQPHRSNSELAFHTLETLEAIQASSDRNEFVEVKSRCERPDPLPAKVLEKWRRFG